jgi:hypothetical protein
MCSKWSGRTDLKGRKGSSKFTANIEAGSSISEFKNERKKQREIQIKNTLGKSKCLKVQVYSRE